MPTELPLIRHSERVDFKRCQKKWYWRWRRGLTPKAKTYGALDLGTWMHEALAMRYKPHTSDEHQPVSLKAAFDFVAERALQAASLVAPDFQMDKAYELQALGSEMAGAYDRYYGDDPDIRPMAVEIPLEFELAMDEKVFAIHKLKPDAVFRDANGFVWLFEHKTAAQIALEHLPIDDQARPYVAMAETALRQLGVLKPKDIFRGVMYNFLRKILPDERQQNAQGQYLNKDGTVSKKQPSPIFVRHPVEISRKGKAIALKRLANEAYMITTMTSLLRTKEFLPDSLLKTPHKSCPRLCEFFEMCKVEDNGGDIRTMEQTMYVRRNPYTYDEDTADIPPSFEL